MMPQHIDFPDQILLDILRHADYKDTVLCRAVCKRWAMVINSSMYLMYSVWLGIHGKMDGDISFSPITSAGRLELLLQHEKAWASLAHRQLDIIHPKPALRQRICGENNLEEILGYVSQAGSNFSMLSYRLPSAIAKIEAGEPTTIVSNQHGSLAEFFETFADPDNALLVLMLRAHDENHVRLKFSLRWIHDPSLDHPHARIPILDCGDMIHCPPGHLPGDMLRSIIIGRLMIYQARTRRTMNFLNPSQEMQGGIVAVMIWDWTTGELLTIASFSCWRKDLPPPEPSVPYCVRDP
ncbi:hypothetical protein DL93DRAFT_1222704 [Clavulina sp. PMI_390]|nr:hypothetical protein DL93DRAFT_1222704 [Clavulina sp. PMI_390]